MKLTMEEKEFGTFGYFAARQKTLEEWLNNYSLMQVCL
jgi:hypothetical protein